MPHVRHRFDPFIAPAVIFVVALGVRLIYLHEIRGCAFFDQPVSDGWVYDQRAQGIAAGDWIGPADFVHAPLYAYYLGLIQVVAGDSLWWPRFAQMLGGSLACVLVALTARRLFDARVGWLAGLLLALYPPAIFFDGLIQKASLTLLLCALLLWLVMRLADAPTRWGWTIAGAVLGLLILTRQNTLLLVPLFFAWLWLTARKHPRRQRAAWTAFAALGLVVTLFPWALRNRVVLGDWVLTTPNLGQNFAMGNHPQATGTYLPFQRGRASGRYEQQAWVRAAERARGRSLSAQEVSEYYLDAALAWIRANPSAWLMLTLKKGLLVCNAYETPDTEDYYLYQTWSLPLHLLDTFWHFGVLAPLAAVGLWFSRAQWRRLWFLYGWLVIVTVAVAAFVVFARYRFPLVPVLVIFAASGLVSAVRLFRVQASRRLAVPGVLLLLVAIAANVPVLHARRPSIGAYRNYAVALADGRRYDESLGTLNQVLETAPDDVDAHLIMASVLQDMGRYQEAYEHYDRARTGDPKLARAYRGLGDCLVALGRVDEAVEQFRRAVDLDPQDHVSLNCLAAAYARQGRFTDAFELFARVLQLAPNYPEAYVSIGSAYFTAKRYDDAATAYEAALLIDPNHLNALQNLGIVAVQQGDYAAALSHLRHLIQLAPQRRDAQHQFVRALVLAHQYDEARAYVETLLAREPDREDLQHLQRFIERAQSGP